MLPIVSERAEDSNVRHEGCWIERPLCFRGSLTFRPDNTKDIERAKSSWSFLPIYTVWSYGVNREELVQWFDSIPPNIVSVLQRVLSNIHNQLLQRGPIEKNETDLSLTDPFPLENPFRSVEESDEMGEYFESLSLAYMRIEYDPSTLERKCVFANKMNSFIEHMHREEYLARMAGHDLSISMPPFDFLCFLVAGILQFSEPRLERCFRLCKMSSASGGAMLVHATTIRCFNAVGRISKAGPPDRPPTRPMAHLPTHIPIPQRDNDRARER